jgi:hypothetical protein
MYKRARRLGGLKRPVLADSAGQKEAEARPVWFSEIKKRSLKRKFFENRITEGKTTEKEQVFSKSWRKRFQKPVERQEFGTTVLKSD